MLVVQVIVNIIANPFSNKIMVQVFLAYPSHLKRLHFYFPKEHPHIIGIIFLFIFHPSRELALLYTARCCIGNMHF